MIYSFISLPTVRDDDNNMVCYSGSLLQTFKITEDPQVLYTEPLPGDAKMHEVLLSASMSCQTNLRVTSPVLVRDSFPLIINVPDDRLTLL